MTIIPQRLFLEITTECNLRCKLCKSWEQKDPSNKLNLATKLIFLKEYIKWLDKSNDSYKNMISVILTGGEPFLYPDQVFEIAKICQDNGIKCYVISNGSLIAHKLDEILNSGLSALTLSIDSHLAKTHDYLRGEFGLFNKLLSLIRELKSKRDEKNYPIKICVQSILGDWNIDSLPAHIDFFKGLGTDGIMFQPIQYPFGLLIPENWHKNYDKFPNSEEEIQNAMNYLMETKQQDGFIMNSREEIALWGYYFKNPEYISKISNPCRAFEQNLIIDISGNVKFCFSKEIEPKNKIGNITTTSIDDMWNGKSALQEIAEMRSCIRACGIMACHIDTKLREN